MVASAYQTASPTAVARRPRARGGSPRPPRARARVRACPRGPPWRTGAGLVAVVDRGQHQPGAIGVEQGDRGRLAARHLAVGVVADQRPVGHRPSIRRSARPSAGRAARRHPGRSRERLELLLKRRGVRDQVLLAVTQDHPLSGPYAAQLEPPGPRREKGQQGDRAGSHRHDASRAGQVVHCRQDTVTADGRANPRRRRAGRPRRRASAYWKVDREGQGVVRRVLLAGHRPIVAVSCGTPRRSAS